MMFVQKPANLTLYYRYRNLFYQAYPHTLPPPRPLTPAQIVREKQLEQIIEAAQTDWDPSAESWTAFVKRLRKANNVSQ